MKIVPLDRLDIRQHVALANFSTFGIGGPARYFAEVKSLQHFAACREFAEQKELPMLIIGRGSNCLFDDRGFEGLAIFNDMAKLQWRDLIVEVESGYSMAKLAVQSARFGLRGLEFGCGIPGSVGGAIFMNAGAHGSETCDTLVSVDIIDSRGDVHQWETKRLALGYRHSIFQKDPYFIWRARFALQKDPEALTRCRLWAQQRVRSQPYKLQSAGCAFRNPKGNSAGHLIEMAGLKGMRIGDAQVSPHHANYLINCGKATSKEVQMLIDHVQQTVLQRCGVALQTELRMISPKIQRQASLSGPSPQPPSH